MATTQVRVEIERQKPRAWTLILRGDQTDASGKILSETLYKYSFGADGNLLNTNDKIIDVPVRATGSRHFTAELPREEMDGTVKTRQDEFFLTKSDDVQNLADLITAGGAATDSVKDYVDDKVSTHSNTRGTSGVFGHVRVDGVSIASDNGLISVGTIDGGEV